MEYWNDGLITKELELDSIAVQIVFHFPEFHLGQIAAQQEWLAPTNIEQILYYVTDHRVIIIFFNRTT